MSSLNAFFINFHPRLLATLLTFGSFMSSACVQLHHAQVGTIDNRSSGEPFELLVSETGINLKEATMVAKGLANNRKAREQTDQISNIIQWFYMGPRTGNMVFDETYPDQIIAMIAEKCPRGEVKNLVSIREANKYPVVSGEIVKIKGLCVSQKHIQAENQTNSKLSSLQEN